MANCITLSAGRKLPCKGGNGGIRAIGLAPWDSASIITGVDGEVSAMTGVTEIYRYELKATGNLYTEEITADSDARTVLYTGTLTAILHKLDVETRNQVKMLAMGEVNIFIEDNNGNIFLIGAGSGAELTGGNFATGGARADFYGATLTFTTLENEPYLTLDAAAMAEYAGKIVE
jgi:hypothetical protein